MIVAHVIEEICPLLRYTQVYPVITKVRNWILYCVS
jgi:hypothetical protein